MTKPQKLPPHETLKYAIGLITSVAGLVAGLAYLTQREQCGLYGLPSGLCESEAASPYALSLLFYLVAESVLIVCLVVFLVAQKRQFCLLWAKWCKATLPKVSDRWRVGLIAAATIVALIPFYDLHLLHGYLWQSLPLHDAAAASIMALILDGNLPRLLVGAAAIGVVVLVFWFQIRLLRVWLHGLQPVRFILATGVVFIGLLVVAGAVAIHGAFIPPTADTPHVVVHLRMPLAGQTKPIDGVLVRQTDTLFFLLTLPPNHPQTLILPISAIDDIEYKGDSMEIRDILLSRALGPKCLPNDTMNETERHKLKQDCTMPIRFTFGPWHLSLASWGWLTLLLLSCGFAVMLPAEADGTPKPPSAKTTQSVKEASILSPVLLAKLQGFFPVLIALPGEAAEHIEQLASLFTRGGRNADGNIVLYMHGKFVPLTEDGGYASPRPSPDGTHLAFVHKGMIGILDVAAKTQHMLAATDGAVRIYGWDKETASLLVLRKDGSLVRVATSDGQSTVIAASPTTDLMTALEVLGRQNAAGDMLIVRESDGTFAVQVHKRHGGDQPAEFESAQAIADPAWSGEKIVYVVSDPAGQDQK